MKRDELKKILMPIVKECIRESITEEGILSGIISEVVKGVSPATPLVEVSAPENPDRFEEERELRAKKSAKALRERKHKLMDAMGKDSYNGINVFEGTDPLSRAGDPSATTQMPSVLGDNPRDAGVDISSLLPGMSQKWKQI